MHVWQMKPVVSPGHTALTVRARELRSRERRMNLALIIELIQPDVTHQLQTLIAD
jgi:hypothetical protein